MLSIFRRTRSSLSLPLVALIACAVAAPAASAAAAGSGSVAVTIGRDGRAAQALAAGGVKTTAVAPAKKRGKRFELPVRSIAVGRSATVALRGGIRLAAGSRAVRLRSLRVKVAPKRVTVSARFGARHLVVLAAVPSRATAELDRADVTAKLAGARLRLTRAGARILRDRLDLSDIRHGGLGKLSIDAARKPSGNQGPGGPGGGGPGAVPQPGPIVNEPPVLPRPASAVDVTGIAIAWYPRDSWVRYLASGVGPQDGSFATGGATKGAPMTSPAHPCSDAAYGGASGDTFDYEFHYAPKSGWYDPPTGAAAILGQGSVSFKWQSHGIDLTASDPEIQLNATDPHATFRFSGSGGTAYPDQRAELLDLDLAGQPTVTDGGRTRTYAYARGRLTTDGQAVFAGFYPPPNDGFGCVSVAFTTP